MEIKQIYQVVRQSSNFKHTIYEEVMFGFFWQTLLTEKTLFSKFNVFLSRVWPS